jgi:2-oxoglutarate ferredoxin oxidoreductase subunit gamma
MTERIIIAGAGGQGIMLLGKVLAEAAMLEGKHVIWLPAYGPEVRGGTAHCTVIISDEPIASPYVFAADTLIVMNEPSLAKFRSRLSAQGIMFVNSSMVKEEADLQDAGSRYPFTEKAIELGNIKTANMVALGCFIGKKKIVSPESVVKAMESLAPAGKQELVQINKKALRSGQAMVGS